MSKHTPGPWRVRTERGEVWSERKGFSPCLVTQAAPKETRAERDANARLIAAAPELLEALRNLAAIVDAAIIADDWKVDGACDPAADIRCARAAIAKATGA